MVYVLLIGMDQKTYEMRVIGMDQKTYELPGKMMQS